MESVAARGLRVVDAFVRSASLRETVALCRDLEPLDLPSMVRRARREVTREILGGGGFGTRSVPLGSEKGWCELFYGLLLPISVKLGQLSTGIANGVELLEGLAQRLERPLAQVEEAGLLALESALATEHPEASWARLLAVHTVGVQEPTALRFLKAVVHLHLAAADARCRFTTDAGLRELGIESWLHLPEEEQDVDRAKMQTDGGDMDFLNKLRGLGIPHLLALSARARREILDYWAANDGPSPPAHKRGKTS